MNGINIHLNYLNTVAVVLAVPTFCQQEQQQQY
jgi:hypothetical protein